MPGHTPTSYRMAPGYKVPFPTAGKVERSGALFRGSPYPVNGMRTVAGPSCGRWWILKTCNSAAHSITRMCGAAGATDQPIHARCCSGYFHHPELRWDVLATPEAPEENGSQYSCQISSSRLRMTKVAAYKPLQPLGVVCICSDQPELLPD